MTMNFNSYINRKMGRQLLILVVAGLIVSSAFAQQLEAASIDAFRLLMGLFGGLALFLFGIDQMSHGLKAVAGDRMASLLGNDQCRVKFGVSFRAYVRNLDYSYIYLDFSFQ